jgi:hypothetical protein
MNDRGFSIVEWLMISSIAAVIISLAIIAIDPIGHSAASANAKRWSDVNTLASALARYQSDHGGAPPSGVDAGEREICVVMDKAVCGEKGLLDLTELAGTYIERIPADPTAGSSFGSGYRVRLSPEGRIIVSAPNAANGEHIAIGE